MSSPSSSSSGSKRATAPREQQQAVPDTKTCTGCGRTLALDKFEKGRSKCRECRRRENHDREQRRAAEQAPAERRPAITADELARRSARYGAAEPRELESWLVAERLAEPTAAGLVATPRGLDLADALDLTPVAGSFYAAQTKACE